MKEYQVLYSEFEAQRGELTNAEKLFDLSITGYPHLLEVEKDLKNSVLVFELYEAQRVSGYIFSASSIIFPYFYGDGRNSKNTYNSG